MRHLHRRWGLDVTPLVLGRRLEKAKPRRTRFQRLPPISVDSNHVLAATVHYKAALRRAFRALAQSVATQVKHKLDQRQKLAKQDDDSGQDEGADWTTATGIADSLDLSALTMVVDSASELGASVAGDTGRVALAQFGMNDNSDIVDQVDQRAADWSDDRAAELVGMRYNSAGELVPAARASMRIDEATRNMIRQTIFLGLQEGWRSHEIADSLQNDHAFSEDRAALIANTECLMPETLVTAAHVTAAHRRFYNGEIIEITTKSGRKITATPNHPMLSQKGWQAAGALRKGDYLVCNGGQQNSLGRQDVKDRPPTISEVFDALALVGVVERVSSVSKDFHGDGIADSNVDIATPNGPLVVGNFSSLNKPVLDQLFSPTDCATPACCPRCGALLSDKGVCFCVRPQLDTSSFKDAFYKSSFLPIFLSQGANTGAFKVACDDGSVGQIGSKLIGHLAVDISLFSSGSGASYDPCLPDYSGANIQRGSGQSRCVMNRLPTFVGGDDSSFCDVIDVVPCFSTQFDSVSSASHKFMGVENSHNNPATFLGSRRNLINGEAAAIEFDDVVLVRRARFSGHVYNLTTCCGYFVANETYTGNTRRAHSQGALIGYEQAAANGVKVMKGWSTSGDNPCQDCQDNEDEGSIPLGQDFQSGDDAPPAHPNCRCVIVPVVLDAGWGGAAISALASRELTETETKSIAAAKDGRNMSFNTGEKNPYFTKQDIFAHAYPARDTLASWLHSDTGPLASLGPIRFFHAAPDDVANSAYNQPGPILFGIGVKKEARATEKVTYEYDGEWERLFDSYRTTVAVDSPEDAYTVAADLVRSGLAVRVKDTQHDPLEDTHWRDIKINIRMPNGLIGEIAIVTKKMLLAKNVGHAYYETSRTIEAKYTVDGVKKPKSEWAPEDYDKWKVAVDKQAELYDETWRQSESIRQ